MRIPRSNPSPFYTYLAICQWLGSPEDRKVSKREQGQGNPPEPKSVVCHERIGGRTAAGDEVGGMQRITPWAMKYISVEEITREGATAVGGNLTGTIARF